MKTLKISAVILACCLATPVFADDVKKDGSAVYVNLYCPPASALSHKANSNWKLADKEWVVIGGNKSNYLQLPKDATLNVYVTLEPDEQWIATCQYQFNFHTEKDNEGNPYETHETVNVKYRDVFSHVNFWGPNFGMYEHFKPFNKNNKDPEIFICEEPDPFNPGHCYWDGIGVKNVQ
jgi:hypothetical protein